MDLRRLGLFVFTLSVLQVTAGCAGSRRGRRPPPPPPPAPVEKADATAIWFGSDDTTKKPTGRLDSTQKIERGRRTLPVSRRRGRPGGTSPIGTNLAHPSLDGRDWAFLNAFRFASPWTSRDRRGKKDSDLVHLDPDGWVQALNYGQQAEARVPTLTGGKMVVLYDGRGILTIEGAKVLGEGDGRLVIQAKPYDVIRVVVKATNPSDNVRNIRIVPESLETSADREAFHPLFVRRMTKYSVLRFADWGRAATTPIARWEDRTSWSAANQTGDNGVAYEYMIQLANEVGTDLWLSVPYAADDQFVGQLAQLVRDNLDEDLKVYVEYATEIWRPGTAAYAYAQREGQFRNLDRDPNVARLYFQSQRSVEVFNTFRQVFGEEEGRVIRVMASHAGATAEQERLLGFQRAADQTDLLAIDAFVGTDLVTGANARDLVRRGAKGIVDLLLEAVPKTLADTRASARIADRYEVGLAAYRGGQDLVAPSSAKDDRDLQQVLDAANRDRGMAEVYTALLDGWRRSGGELFVHDSFATPFGAEGRAGSVEYVDQPRRVTPKHDALLSFAEKNPRWWDDKPKVEQRTAAAPPDGAPPPPPNTIIAPPPGGGLQTDVEPVSNTGVWTAGTVGAAGIGIGWLFTGLYLSAAGDRDVLLAEQVNLPDGKPARDLDNTAYRHSIGASLGFTLAVAGAGTAFVMSVVSDLPIEDAAEPAMWLSGAAGVVSAIAGTAFLMAHSSTKSARDERIANNPMPDNSAPIRTLDNEAFRWGLASLGAYTVAAAGLGTALWLWLSEPTSSSSGDYYLDTYYEDQGFTILPTGLMYRW